MKIFESIKKPKTKSLISCGFIFFVSFILIYCYVNVYSSSDYPAHIKYALRGEGYSLVSSIIVLCNKIDPSNLLFIFFMALATSLTVIACSFYIKTVSKILGMKCDLFRFIPLAATALFICKLCIPEWSVHYYVDAFVTQPWHNSTYTLMRLTAIPTLSCYFLIEKDYAEKIDLKYCLFFLLFLILTNMSKPNFVIVFAPAMLCMLAYDFIRTKAKSFKNAFIFGVFVLIACFVLIGQYKTSFPSGGDSGIAFSVSNAIAFISKDKKLPLYLVLNYAFPLYVTYHAIKNRKDSRIFHGRMLIESWGMTLLSILVYLFVAETGPRAADGNFGWGMPFFSFVLFVTCLSYLETFKEKGILSEKDYTLGKAIYFAHIIFGLFYFGILMMGYLSWGY